MHEAIRREGLAAGQIVVALKGHDSGRCFLLTKVEGRRVNDCAAGSGRLLLAHYMEVSKLDHSAGRPFVYIAHDSDPLVCKMCALNMMVHGMNGTVICQDTLTQSTPSAVYRINEIRYPFNTPYYSVRVKSGF